MNVGLREEQNLILFKLKEQPFKSILIEAYAGAGKTLPLVLYGIEQPGKKLVITFRRNNYLSFLREKIRAEFIRNRSIKMTALFGREIQKDGAKNVLLYFNAEALDIISKYSVVLGVSSYDWLYSLAKSAEFIVADVHHFLNKKEFERFIRRTRINLQETLLIIDEVHNLLELGIQNPRLLFSFIESVSGFKQIIGSSATPFPTSLFGQIFSKHIKLPDKRRVRIFVYRNINMSYATRGKYISKIYELLRNVEKEEVAFYQNKQLLERIRKGNAFVFRGKYNESVDMNTSKLHVVGLPFPHISYKSNIEELAKFFFIPAREIIDGYVASKFLQAIGRAVRNSSSTVDVYVYDNRLLRPGILKYIPKSYVVNVV
jgi:Rad3-related DNA helicase